MTTAATAAPEAVTVDISEIPSHESDTMCRVLVKCVTRFFEDPANKADYECWKQERQQKGAAHA